MTYGLARRLPAQLDDGLGIEEFGELLEDSEVARFIAMSVLGFLEDLRLDNAHLNRIPLVVAYSSAM